jgi:Fe-S-cluster containining protein
MTMATGDDSGVRVDFHVAQGSDGLKVTLSCSDRTSVVPLSQLLSSLRSLTDKVVLAAAAREGSAGREISCKVGCGACCRQLVPISVTEAEQLPNLIAGLSEAHRSRVMARFDDAISRLKASSVWDRLRTYWILSRDERVNLAIEYFRLGIACPFLEDESCSIHPVRPLKCREYLVTSPASHCSDPTPENISRLALAANVSGALQRIERRDRTRSRAVPLILAPFLNLAATEPGKTVPDWMSRLLAAIKKLRAEQIAATNEAGARGCKNGGS